MQKAIQLKSKTNLIITYTGANMQANTNINNVELAKSKEKSVGLMIGHQQVRVMRKSSVNVSKDLKISGNAVIKNIDKGVTLDIADGNLDVQGDIEDGVSINIRNGNITVEGFIRNDVSLNVICGRVKVI